MICRTIDEVLQEGLRIIADDKAVNSEDGAEYFFRGENLNFRLKDTDPSGALDCSFPCSLDRNDGWVEHERDLYQEALRRNIISFSDDRTMVELVGRMQHYQLPTRFADLSQNIMTAAHFACDGDVPVKERDKGNDGYIRVFKVAKKKMKSFTSDIITAIAHLPLVKPERIMPSEPDGLDVLRYEVTNERPGFSMDVGESGSLRDVKDLLRTEIQQIWAFKPIWNNPRIRSQNGLFLAFGCGDRKKQLNCDFSEVNYHDENQPTHGIMQVGYVQIAAGAKKAIRESLLYCGDPQLSTYTDLSNVCAELSNTYKKEDK